MNKKYFLAFIIFFAIEVFIALFVHDKFIRPYVGDVLVVVLLYCFVKIFFSRLKFLPVYIFIFAAMVELAQYFQIVDMLGLTDNTIARIAIGSTFDVKDIVCYFGGCVGLFVFEKYYPIKRR